MWIPRNTKLEGVAKFYSVMFNYDEMGNLFKMNFEMKNLYDYSETEINEMIPYERDIYISLILNDLQQKKENANKR